MKTITFRRVNFKYSARDEKAWVWVIINVMPWNITVDFLVDGDDLVGIGLGADTGEPQFEVHWED